MRLENEGYRCLVYRVAPALFIIAIVFIFNLPYLFIDALWIDDGHHFFYASEESYSHLAMTKRASIGFLIPFRLHFYSYGMVEWGLPVIRGIYVLIMATSSILFFYFYRRIFGMNDGVALFAAVVPNILPSLESIPFGLVTSYAMWSLVPILASMVILRYAFTARLTVSLLTVSVAFILYVVGLNLSSAGMFFVPCLLFLCFMFFPVAKIRSLLYSSLFLLYGFWQVFRYLQYGRKDPSVIPVTEVMDRICLLFEMVSFLPFNHPYSIYITSGLVLAGIFGLVARSPRIYMLPPHFNYDSRLYSIMLTFWPIVWMVANSIAYVTASQSFRYEDYAYVFNFGAVFLQGIGLFYLGNIVIYKLLPNRRVVELCLGIMLVSVIVFCGFQRIHYKDTSLARYNYNDIPVLEWRTSLLRNQLSEIVIPQGTQIILLDIDDRHHPGWIINNSGYLRYVLKRNDIYALYGKDRYPHDIFDLNNRRRFSMSGFDSSKPTMAFRYRNGTLQRVGMVLQVVSKDTTGHRTVLDWTLYDIRSAETQPHVLAHGEGMLSYWKYTQKKMPGDLRKEDIAFAPEGKPHDLVGAEYAHSVLSENNMLSSSINFSDNFTLLGVVAENNETLYTLKVLLRLDKNPEPPFRLGYRLGRTGGIGAGYERLPIGAYAKEGDYLILNISNIVPRVLAEGITFSLTNNTGWPPTPLVINGGAYDGKSEISLQWVSDCLSDKPVAGGGLSK
jgi:hypothetical protein